MSLFKPSKKKSTDDEVTPAHSEPIAELAPEPMPIQPAPWQAAYVASDESAAARATLAYPGHMSTCAKQGRRNDACSCGVG